MSGDLDILKKMGAMSYMPDLDVLAEEARNVAGFTEGLLPWEMVSEAHRECWRKMARFCFDAGVASVTSVASLSGQEHEIIEALAEAAYTARFSEADFERGYQHRWSEARLTDEARNTWRRVALAVFREAAPRIGIANRPTREAV